MEVKYMVGPVFIRETDDFAGRFNELLIHNQETAVTAATRLEVSPAVITKWRQGKSIPSGEYIKRIVETYHVSADYLLGVIDTPTRRISDDEVSKYTGLSLSAVRALHRICSSARKESQDGSMSFYNLLSGENLESILGKFRDIESAISQVQKVMPNTEGAAGKDAKEPHSLRIKFEKQYWENRICEALAYIEMLCVTATGCDVVSPFVTIEPRSGLPLFFAEAERKIASYTRVDDNGNEYWK